MLSSLDSSNTECFLDLFSSFSKVSARIIVSPYPFKSSVFFWDLSTRFCTRSELHQHSILTIARLLRVLTTYLNPLLHAVPRLHVGGHDEWVDHLVVQQLEASAAQGSSLQHQCRPQWCCVFYHHLADDNFSTRTRLRINLYFHPGSGAVVVACTTTGSAVVAPIVVTSMATASEITSSSACSRVKNKSATYDYNNYSTRQVLM